MHVLVLEQTSEHPSRPFVKLEALRSEVGRRLVAGILSGSHHFARGANHRFVRFDEQPDHLERVWSRIGVWNTR